MDTIATIKSIFYFVLAGLFEIGGGSIGNLNALGLAADDLTDIFVSHLHVDHIGDFAMFWGQGFMWGRTIPVTLHGPSGPVPELGTEHFVEHRAVRQAGQRNIQTDSAFDRTDLEKILDQGVHLV